ncbi:MAG: polysaccharide pyruvyl transferase CsaB [Ezakiella sp.]|nr:polysaccharide pyruvyl transferase CsaB [Ezakiella sp.]MDD7472231.1 polysaccharide pyruvyl transferase CsaB [Bacillota bacterium]MDY3923224.1 polysaccharide pyruvyl transferase CsaB [Ezakiella sp.]
MKVLHLISGGDTGGAKTHIMTLLSSLKENVDVTLGVFINDVFLEEAKSLGIKTELFFQKSRFDLSIVGDILDYIKHNNIDLVHCHGARANFIAFFLRRKTDIPFISTVHSDYRLDFKGVFYKQLIFKNLNYLALKKFDNFIAVSDNFKDMLIERKFTDKNIDVVYNGIDLEKEEKFVSKSEFCKRYNLDENSFKIGILARLDEVKDHKTFLRGAAEFLKEEESDFLIGGDGILMPELKEEAKRLGIENNVHFLGEIKDPFSFLNAVDINTLTSLSESFPYVILEGGKFRKPIVASRVGGIPKITIDGETGYTFKSQDYKDFAKKLLIIKRNDNLRERLGNNLYKTIENHFSANAMVNSHIRIYKRAIKDKTILFSGFYGFDNQGDDAILEAITSSIKKENPYLKLKVLSNNPVKTSEVYDLLSVYRFSLPKVIKAVKSSDMLISGGGSLLQDITSSRSLWYYLFVIWLSKKYKKKTVIYANGVGPINKKFNRWLTKRTLKGVDFISLRDRDSFDYLKEIGIEENKMNLRSDPVFLLDSDDVAADKVLKKINLNDNFLALNLRPWFGETRLLKKVEAAIKKYMDDGNKVLLLPMHMSKDVPFLKQFEADIKHENLYSYFDEMSVRSLMGIIKRADAIVSMRLHGLIYSVAVETKPFALSYDPKVSGFMKDINSDYILDVNDFDSDILYQMLVDLKKDDSYIEKIREGEQLRQKLAKENVREVLEILGDEDGNS